jgi:hypothetical protein
MVWYLHDSFVLTESDFFFNWHWKSVAKNNLVFPSFTLTGNATIFFFTSICGFDGIFIKQQMTDANN